MGVNLNPYLHLDGTAAEALAFYTDLFGGKSTSMTFGDMGMEGPEASKIMHGQIETGDGLILMVSDLPPGSAPVQRREGVTISLSGDDDATLRRYWQGLAEGATIETPLEKQMWGDEFGALTDRFGVPWLVNIAGSATA